MSLSILRIILSAGVLSLALPFVTLTDGVSGKPGAASAQTAQGTGISDEGECPANNTMAEAATQPSPTEDGAAAENAGTTGWTGGTGGSQLGTNAQGAVESSPTWQPPTARGLDLAGSADDVATC